MYDKVSANRNYVEEEKKIVKFWKENRIFEKSIEDRKDDPISTCFMTDRRRPTESPISAMC